MIELPLDPASSVPLYRQIARHLRGMIRQGAVVSGERLPATREFARFLGVSRTTLVQAYDLLADEGVLEQRGRSGTYARPSLPGPRRRPEGALPEFDMETAAPDPGLLPADRLSRALRDLALVGEEEIALPSPPEGLPSLRSALVRHAASRGIPAGSESLLVVSGGQEGLACAFCAYRLAGVERAWMEALSYPDAAEMARLEGLSVRSLPLEEGALVATLEELGPADLVYLIPSFHNPTGRTLSAPARRAILEARERRGFRLLEDDTYGELRTGEASVPALRASDEEGAVLYLGSFSQILFPGVRLGYVLPPPELAGIFARVKALRSGSTSSAAQRLALSFLSRGGLDAALEASRPAIGARLARACRRIEEELPGRLYERPNGGIYLWVSTAPLSGEEARALGLPWGVAVADGGVFSVEPRRIEAVRLSVSSLPEGRIDEAIRRLARAWRGDESVPPRRVGPEGRS